jgi:hypothetical protein
MAAQASASADPGPAALTAGFWDFEGPLPARPRRLRRAAAVASVWVLCAIPVAMGWQRCPVATFLHEPCPGCGMTRAIRLLLRGDVAGSLRMHPLAVPVLLVGVMIATASVWSTGSMGSPVRAMQSRVSRVALWVAVAVYAATIALWALRWAGWFGGPVSV